jgi:hypothetical protein
MCVCAAVSDHHVGVLGRGGGGHATLDTQLATVRQLVPDHGNVRLEALLQRIADDAVAATATLEEKAKTGGAAAGGAGSALVE